MKKLLSNEERLRRKRARWAKQAAERRQLTGEFRAVTRQRRSGRPLRAEKFISDAEMNFGWHYFWKIKRGLDMPATTTAGVLG